MKFDFMSKSLSSLADIQTGPFGSQLHKEDYVDIGTPIVTVEHLGRKRFFEQNLPCVSAQDKERLSKYILQEGDIVFSRVGSVDRCSYVSKEYAGWMFSGRCLRVRPNADIDSQFLYYYFTLETTKQFVRGIATGATMPSINTKFMGEVPVVYPSIEIQRKIAGILSAIDNKIDVNNAINENLYEQLTSYYKHLFSAITPSTSVGELVDSIFSGGTPSTSNEAYWNGDHYWLSSGETSERFIVSTIKTITDAGASNSSTRKANKYDIVIASAGQGHTRGQTSMLLTDTYVNQSIIVVHAAPDYLPYLFWNIANRYEELRVISNSNSIRGSLTTKMIGSLSIPKADITQIRQFSDYAWPIVKAVENNLHENRRLAVMRDTLLPRLMSGELDVSALDL